MYIKKLTHRNENEIVKFYTLVPIMEKNLTCGQSGRVIKFDNHVTLQHCGHFGNRRFSYAVRVFHFFIRHCSPYIPISLLEIGEIDTVFQVQERWRSSEDD